MFIIEAQGASRTSLSLPEKLLQVLRTPLPQTCSSISAVKRGTCIWIGLVDCIRDGFGNKGEYRKELVTISEQMDHQAALKVRLKQENMACAEASRESYVAFPRNYLLPGEGARERGWLNLSRVRSQPSKCNHGLEDKEWVVHKDTVSKRETGRLVVSVATWSMRFLFGDV